MSLVKGSHGGLGGSGAPGGPLGSFYTHTLDQSLKFNDSSNPLLKRTPASQGSLTTFTFSFWYKRCVFGTYQEVFHAWSGSGERSQILFENNDKLKVELEAANTNHFITNMAFRDSSAWYNVVVTFDSTNGTQANRVKIYVNGVDQSDTANGGDGFSTANYPSQNATSGFNTTTQHEISTYDESDFHLDGYLAEVNFIDGTALTAASFGETKDGIWIPKDTSSLTFGTNGFHLTFKDDVVSEGFNSVTWRGTGATNSISGLGFSPALVWIKDRTDATVNYLTDVVRGANKEIYSDGGTDGNSDNALAEYTDTNTLTTFDADGFTVGTSTGTNGSADDMVAWCWEASTSFSNDTSATSVGNVDSEGKVNTAKGFSIIKWVYSTSADQTIAHGLDEAPTFIIVKSRTTAYNFDVYHSGLSAASKRLILNHNSGEAAGFFDTAPTSTVFEYNTSAATNGDNMIAYCWHDVDGYSKFGRFTGNGGSQEITVGFEPALVVIKRRDATSNWHVFDNTRNAANPRSSALNWDRTAVEATNAGMTFSSTGFNDNGWISGSGQEIIYMAWADTREAAFFKDVTSNGNHFTPVNLDYRDSVPDVPTNNFATMNALANRSGTLSNGNLSLATTTTQNATDATFQLPSSLKWYFEFAGNSTSSQYGEVGISTAGTELWSNGAGFYGSYARFNNATIKDGLSFGTTDVLQVAYDGSNRKVWLGINNTWYAADGGTDGNPSAGTNESGTLAANDWFPSMWTVSNSGVMTANFGQDSSFNGIKSTANSNADSNGHGSFAYAPPTDFLALCSQNLPDVDIIDGTEHFETVTYTGNSTSGRDLEGFGFQPGFVWFKERGAANNHVLVNGGRGADKGIHSDSESTLEFSGVTSAFTSDGITLTDHGTVNNNNDTYVAWAWKATESFSNDTSATGVGNVDSSGLVNTTAGFSFTTWTADGSVKNIAHGMGKVPTTIWTKPNEDNWFYVYHAGTASDPETDYLALSRTNAVADYAGAWNDTAPTTALWTMGVWSANSGSNEVHISFLFSDVEGFSKHGFYTGNANANGTFVYTGFRPAWIMIKNIVDTEYWSIFDSTRSSYNETNNIITPHVNSAEYAAGGGGLDIVSNGFKIRGTSGNFNGSGDRHIYMAFADQPFKFSNAR